MVERCIKRVEIRQVETTVQRCHSALGEAADHRVVQRIDMEMQ